MDSRYLNALGGEKQNVSNSRLADEFLNEDQEASEVMTKDELQNPAGRYPSAGMTATQQ